MHLPASLTELDMGPLERFDHPLEQLRLPCGLRILRLPWCWNHPIELLQLPPSLTEFNLGDKFNHPLVAWNPPAGLTTFELPGSWALEPSQLRLPPNLQTLALSHLFNTARESLSLLHLSTRLHSLKLGGRIEGDELAALTLPQSLTSLDLGDGCDASLDHVQWPPHLTRLATGMTFKQPLVDWSPPSSLTELFIGDRWGYGWWDLPVSQLRLPSNLHKLTFGSDFNQPLNGLQFPSSLRVLTFGRKFKQSLGRNAWSPPPDLEELHLGTEWNRPCTDLHLPTRLRKLTLSRSFNQRLENERRECALKLPHTLRELRFGVNFDRSLRLLHLPPSLRLLSLPTSHLYPRTHLPSTLPARLQCLEVHDEVTFQKAWARYPQWPKQCAVHIMNV